MAFMTQSERAFARAISELALCNPFLPERIEAERRALGARFVPTGPVWHTRPVPLDVNPNVARLAERAATLADKLRERLAAGADPGPDRALYEDLVTYLLYHRVEPALYKLVTGEGASTGRLGFYPQFAREVRRYLDFRALGAPGSATPIVAAAGSTSRSAAAAPPPAPLDAPHLLAFFFQIRRAFHFTIENILGGSLPAARLRAAVWQAIFTRDMHRYRRGLHQRMHDITTLIVGPTGTGKELVAQAIGLSRYIPVDPAAERFTEDFRGAFFALNLSALPATLIESELFGHRKGAFTGAVDHHPGWLEVCPPLGTVFLDEIAEIDTAIQVKLLRVLQSRTFQRVGDTRERRFHGKIIAATNRDLAAEMQAGRFRPDLYYRLSADVIETPSLEAQLREAPDELPHLLRFLARRIAGEAEAEALAGEAEAWISAHLGPDYRWPGNVRELEQCVRNVMIRGEYRPPRAAPAGVREECAQAFLAGSLSTEEMLRRYVTLVFARTGNYVETARRLGIDRRTVKDRVDSGLLARLRAAGG